MSVIVASATPLARSALAVVRLSGPGALDVAVRVARPMTAAQIRSRVARRVSFAQGDAVFDDGILLWFAGPNSATGEDVVELTCHGNPVIVTLMVDALVAAGARPALAGEFTRRAVENGRMDLVAAEGVHAAIEASAVAGLRVARQALDGAHSAVYAELRMDLCMAAAELEARLDLPGDELATESDDAVVQRIVGVVDRARSLAIGVDRGRIAVDGARVALVGETNAGKSSLFNALLARRRALVHALPGTTRDVLEVRTQVGDTAITLLDTAGERETADPVEAAGLALGRELTDGVDCLVVVLRARPDGLTDGERLILRRTRERRRIVVYNGIDCVEAAPMPDGAIATSATEGTGIGALGSAIEEALRMGALGDGEVVIASVRQAERLRRVAECGDEAIVALPVAGPAVSAAALTDAIAEIDALTGANPREGVLDALFARFCIGK